MSKNSIQGRFSGSSILSTVFLSLILLLSVHAPAFASVTNSFVNKYRAAYETEVIITGTGMETADRFVITNSFSSPRWSWQFSTIRIISDTQVAITLPSIDQFGSYGIDGLDAQIGLLSATQDSPSWTWHPIDLMLFELQPFDGSDGRVWCSQGGFATILNKVVNSENSCQGEIHIPNGVTSVGDGTFSGNRTITKVTLPNSLTLIGNQSFLTNTSLAEIIFSNSLTSIGDQAFENASALTEIVLPNSLTSIGDRAFYQATGLISLSIGSGVLSIGDYTFYANSNLSSINLGSSLRTIGQHAFNSTKIISLVIPDSVISIGTQAFANNEEMSDLKIGSGLTEISNGVFLNAIKLKSIKIPNNVETISAQAFYNTSALETLTIGSKVTEIQSAAFLTSNLIHSLKLGENLTQIATDAFNTATLSCLTNKSSFDSDTLRGLGINYSEPIVNCSEPPSPPSITSVIGGDKNLSVTFSLGEDGGEPITDYEYSLNGGVFVSSGQSTSPIQITGLIGRTAYSVAIKARNSVGLGEVSNSMSATTKDSARDAEESRAAAETARLEVNKSIAESQFIAYKGKIAFEIVKNFETLYSDFETIISNILKIFRIILDIFQKTPSLILE